MSEVRAAAVAGQFYPGEPRQLQHDVDAMLAQVRTDALCPKAIVAPHAGYIYSGSIAAEVYARVRKGAKTVSRVVLLGPSHRVGFEGIATTGAHFYTTPLGQVPLDTGATRDIEKLPGVHLREQAHAEEHSLEVHLPFLQRCLDNFCLIPLVVGNAAPDTVAQVIQALWGGPETLIVISSDLSHFLPYEDALARDSETRRLIEARATGISGDQACGCKPLNGLLEVLRERNLGIETVALNNSGDTAGSKDRVVGYGAWVVEEGNTLTAEKDELQDQATPLSLAQRQQLLFLARTMILHALGRGGEYDIKLKQYHPQLREQRGSFVTLSRGGRLRGCIGSLAATRPLVLDVAHNASAAAFKDPRFKPLQAAEFTDLDIHISVLSPARELTVDSRQELLETLRPGVDGLILQEGNKHSTYLPSVWESLADPQRFVSELRVKAGLPAQGWSSHMQVWTYTTEEFS
jgi:AmmeMemoRadiSam system protein B/AmmeMemoRadiSam system protein A